jgi:hypothetical protein
MRVSLVVVASWEWNGGRPSGGITAVVHLVVLQRPTLLLDQMWFAALDDGNAQVALHRSGVTTGPRSVKLIVIVPCWSVRQICAPTSSSSASAFGFG